MDKGHAKKIMPVGRRRAIILKPNFQIQKFIGIMIAIFFFVTIQLNDGKPWIILGPFGIITEFFKFCAKGCPKSVLISTSLFC